MVAMIPRAVALTVLVTVMSVIAPDATSQAFVDVTPASGVSIPAHALASGHDRGACWGDFDGDGDQDLVVADYYSLPILYFRNDGSSQFTDLTASNPVGFSLVARGIVAADVDNDGDLDVYQCNANTPNQLFINDGTGVFTDQAASAGVDDWGEGWCATFGDYDRDGWVDLYVGNFTQGSASGSNVLYRNNGDGTFTDVTAATGAGDGGLCLTCLFHDYDEDGWPDIFVGNDRGYLALYPGNTTYRNNGNGTFTDVGQAIGSAVDMAAMGSDFSDAFNDGGWDVFVSDDPPTHVFLEWDAVAGAYVDKASICGFQAGQAGWAVNFMDYDNDGWQDLYVVQSTTALVTGVNRMFRNPGNGGTWPDMAGALGLGLPGAKYCSTIADFDDDGRVDILQMQTFGPGLLMRNQVSAGNWLKVRCVGSTSNRSGIGAVVAVTAGGMTRRQIVRMGSGYLGGRDLRLNFGLGPETVAEVDITWPSGQLQKFSAVVANQILEAVEPGLELGAAPILGTSVPLSLSVPGDEFLPYALVLALGATPGIPLPDGRVIPANADPLALLALTPGNAILQQSMGVLGVSGLAQATLNIPGSPFLAGWTIYCSGVTVHAAASSGIRTIITPPLPVILQ